MCVCMYMCVCVCLVHQIWMLTGDKQETAMNIGYATLLINDDMKQIVATVDTAGSVAQSVDLIAATADRLDGGEEGVSGRPLALVVDEKTLDGALKSKASKARLLVVAQACKAVICCRARPDQKAAMVQMIRDGVPGVRTLAIGDGANDVDMIQTAHIGVGIAGAEGVQAANASDFAIARFMFLNKLLLVHGRWNYQRMSKLILYMFEKNILVTLVQFWFAFTNGFSGQKFFPELAIQSYNIVYTGLPIIALAVLDQDVSARLAVRYPQLYATGPAGVHFNTKVFWCVVCRVSCVVCRVSCGDGVRAQAVGGVCCV